MKIAIPCGTEATTNSLPPPPCLRLMEAPLQKVWPWRWGSLPLHFQSVDMISYQRMWHHWDGQKTSISHPVQLYVAEAKFLVSVAESSRVPFLHLPPIHKVKTLTSEWEGYNTGALTTLPPVTHRMEVSCWER